MEIRYDGNWKTVDPIWPLYKENIITMKSTLMVVQPYSNNPCEKLHVNCWTIKVN